MHASGPPIRAARFAPVLQTVSVRNGERGVALLASVRLPSSTQSIQGPSVASVPRGRDRSPGHVLCLPILQRISAPWSYRRLLYASHLGVGWGKYERNTRCSGLEPECLGDRTPSQLPQP